MKIDRQWLVMAGWLVTVAAMAEPGTNGVVRLPEITVVAEKEPAAAQTVPVSVTAVSPAATIRDADVRTVNEAAVAAPNVHLAEFTSRSLSLPYVRGLGGSPANTAVTTYYDGVPQLHAYSSNLELVDIEQVEFVRGAQGMFYGRNTLGGVINVLSRRPAAKWEGEVAGGFGNYHAWDGRFRTSGPLVAGQLGLSVAGGYAARDGFTKNDITGNDVDSREALFGKLQLQWTPFTMWAVRFILSGERDRDGDYALGDLAALRVQPHRVQRDFEGFANRDVLLPVLVVERLGERVNFTATSGLVWWRTHEMTDLDYSPVPAVRREARLSDTQFTQELRWASPVDAPVELGDALKLRWQAGLFGFTRAYREHSVNRYAPYVLDPGIDFPVEQTSPWARLNDAGVGGYGQTTWVAWDKLELGLGLRADYERKEANLRSYYTPAIGPVIATEADADFTQLSPQFSLAWHVMPGRMVYGVISRGYRAGGFNPVGPATYGSETSWHFEIGAKTAWWDERLTVNAAAFYIAWQDLQLNLPVGPTYYIANAGDAHSRGVELELNLRAARGWDLFAGVGYADARFNDGATSLRTDAFGVNTVVDVGGNRLIYAPEFTAHAGSQLVVELRPHVTAYARAEVCGTGRYFYNAANTAAQDAYWLANFRVGLRLKHAFIEGWIKNAFDQKYVPVAFEFPNYQSGFLGESGAPMTCGLRAGLRF